MKRNYPSGAEKTKKKEEEEKEGVFSTFFNVFNVGAGCDGIHSRGSGMGRDSFFTLARDWDGMGLFLWEWDGTGMKNHSRVTL